MARETKEQKTERLALEALEYEMEQRRFRESVPKRLFEAQALAQTLGVQVHLTMTEIGPEVNFAEYKFFKYTFHEETLDYNTAEWMLDSLEQNLQTLKELKEAYQSRKVLAEAAFEKLTKEEKEAVKEHIHSLWIR